jgi:PEGA domain
MKAGEIYNKVAASYRLAYHKLRGKISSVTDTVVDLDFSILKLICFFIFFIVLAFFVVILIILSALIVCFIIILIASFISCIFGYFNNDNMPPFKDTITSLAPHTSLRMVSIPEGANIFFDGKYVGVTPKNIPISDLGIYSIHLELNGYESWEEECTFDQLDTQGIVAHLNKTQPVTVKHDYPTSHVPHTFFRMVSIPEGANIFFDGEYVGVTPTNISISYPGTYSIRLELNGYGSWEEEYTFDQLDTKEIVAHLNKTQTATVTHDYYTTPNFLGLSALITVLSVYFIMRKKE